MNPKILENAVKAGILAALLTPFAVNMDLYFPFVASKGLWFMACAQLAFFSWLILAWHWKNYRPDFRNPVILAVLAYLGVLFLSAILGADFSASFWSTFERMGGVLMFCHLTGFMIAAVSVLSSRDWRNLFFASIILALMAGLRALFDQSAAARGGGFLGNDSFLGTYLLFNIFIALYLFWSEKKSGGGRGMKIARIIFIALAFCLLFQGTRLWAGIVAGNFLMPETGIIKDIFSSGARAAKISFLGGLALAGIFWLAMSKKRTIKITGRFLMLVLISAGIIFLVFAIKPGNIIYEQMVEKFSEGTVRGRLVVWEIAWQGFLERPIFGWGPENFSLVFARYYNPCLGSIECGGEVWYDRAHNIVIGNLVETGAVGLAAYLAVFAAAIFVLWQNRYRENGVTAIIIFSSLFAAYFAQNLTVFDMPASYLMLFLCLGFIAANFNQSAQKPKVSTRSKNRRILTVALATAAICFFAFVFLPWSAAAAVIEASKAPFFSADKLMLHQRALELSPLGIRQIRLFFARQWLLVAENKELIEKAKKGEISEQEINRYFEFFTNELKKSANDSGLDFASRLKLGRLYRQWSVFDRDKIHDAAVFLEEAKTLSPKNQQPYWELAQIKLYEKDIAAAAELARQSFDLYPKNKKAQKIVDEIQKIGDQVADGNNK